MTVVTVKLEKVVDILSGFAFKSELFNNSEGMPIIRIRDVVRGFSKTCYSGEFGNNFLVQNDETVIGMDGNFNVAKWKGGPALLNQRVCKIKAREGILDDDYLFHFLPKALKKIEDSTPFVTVKHLSVKGVKEIDIPLPTIPEQRRIAAILDQADALRVQRQEALVQLDSLTQSIFIEMFGEPVANSKEWPDSTTLGEIAQIVSGITKGRPLNGKLARTVPYLAVANVQDKALNLSAVKDIDATEDEIQRYKLKKNDLLLTEGGDPDKLGRGTLWNDELLECIHQNHIFRVRLITEQLTPLFLNWLVSSQRGKKYFLRSAKQTTGIASINMTQLRSFPLLLPPMKLQQDFIRVAGVIESQQIIQRRCLAELDALFASLQHRAFRGEL